MTFNADAGLHGEYVWTRGALGGVPSGFVSSYPHSQSPSGLEAKAKEMASEVLIGLSCSKWVAHDGGNWLVGVELDNE